MVEYDSENTPPRFLRVETVYVVLALLLAPLVVFSVLAPGLAATPSDSSTPSDSDLELVDVGPYNGVNIPTDYQVDKDWSSFITSEDKSCAPYVDLNGIDDEVEAVECRGEYPVLVPKVSGEAVDTISNDTETWTLTKISDGGESGSCAEQLSKYPFWDCTSNDGIVLSGRNVQYKLTLEFKAGPARDVDFGWGLPGVDNPPLNGMCDGSVVLKTSRGAGKCTVSIPENKAGTVSFVAQGFSQISWSRSRFFFKFSPTIYIPYIDPQKTKYLKVDPVTVIFTASRQIAIDYNVDTRNKPGLSSEKVTPGRSLLSTSSVKVYSPDKNKNRYPSNAVKSVDIVPISKIPAGTSWSYWRDTSCRSYSNCPPSGKVNYDSAVRVFDNDDTLFSNFSSNMKLNLPYNLDWDQEVSYSFRAENIEYYKVFYSDEDDPSDNEITLRLYTGPKPYEYSNYSYTCKKPQVPNYKGSYISEQNSSLTDLSTGEDLGWTNMGSYVTSNTLIKLEATAHFDKPSKDSDGWVYFVVPRQSDGRFPENITISTDGWIKKWGTKDQDYVASEGYFDSRNTYIINYSDDSPVNYRTYPIYAKKLTDAEDVTVTVISNKMRPYTSNANYYLQNIEFFTKDGGRYNRSSYDQNCSNLDLTFADNLIKYYDWNAKVKVGETVNLTFHPYKYQYNYSGWTEFFVADRKDVEWRVKEVDYQVTNPSPDELYLNSVSIEANDKNVQPHKIDSNNWRLSYSGSSFDDSLSIESLNPSFNATVLVKSLNNQYGPGLRFEASKLVLVNNFGDEVRGNPSGWPPYASYRLIPAKGVAHLSQAVGNSVAEKDKPITFGFQTLSADVYSDTSERKYMNMVLLPFKDDSALIESVRPRMGTMDVPVQNYSGTYRLASEPVINSGRPNTVYYTFDSPTTLDERDYRWLTKDEAAAENLDWRNATAFKVVYDEENIDALKGILADGTVTIQPTGNSVGDRYNLWVGPPNTVGDESTFNRQVSPPATGVVVAQSVSGKVWWDINADKTFNNGKEEGLNHVKVELYSVPDNTDAKPVKVAESFTDRQGGYVFKNVPSGKYVVKVAQSNSDGYVPSTIDWKDPNLVVSRTFTYGSSTPVEDAGVTVPLGSDVTNVDFGFSAHEEDDPVDEGQIPRVKVTMPMTGGAGLLGIVVMAAAVVLTSVGVASLAHRRRKA